MVLAVLASTALDFRSPDLPVSDLLVQGSSYRGLPSIPPFVPAAFPPLTTSLPTSSMTYFGPSILRFWVACLAGSWAPPLTSASPSPDLSVLPPSSMLSTVLPHAQLRFLTHSSWALAAPTADLASLLTASDQLPTVVAPSLAQVEVASSSVAVAPRSAPVEVASSSEPKGEDSSSVL